MESEMKAVEGWKTETLGRVARLTMGQSPDSRYYSEEENGLPFLQGCAEFKGRFPKHSLYCSQTKKIATVGSILFSVRAPVGRINIADRDYIIGRGLAGIFGIEVDQNYLEHYLTFVEQNFRNASQGSTFEAINSSELNGWPIEHPVSKTEQAKIAEILSTVDRAIEQTEALIAKQQHIKTGLMQDLLTRGIDEHGNLRTEQTHKFKDSPLGRIPVEWEVVPLSELADAIDPQPDHRTPAEVADGVPYIGVSDFNEDESINFDKARKVSVAALRKQQKAFLISENDFVFGKIGTIGAPSRIPTCIEYAISANVILLKPFEAPSFVYWWMASPIAERRVDLELHTTSQPAFGIQKMRTFKIPKPSKEEREEIGDLLNKVGSVEQCTERDLKKLQSLKTSLMQDLLKGKIRVTSLIKQ